MWASPHISPRAAKIAPDFAPVRVLGRALSRGARGDTPRMNKSIAGPMVERAWTRTGAKDKRDRGQRTVLPPQRPSLGMKLNENKELSEKE